LPARNYSFIDAPNPNEKNKKLQQAKPLLMYNEMGKQIRSGGQKLRGVQSATSWDSFPLE